MSIQLEVQRLENAKSSIAAAIEAKGVTVPPTAKIDTYGDYVRQIEDSATLEQKLLDGTVVPLKVQQVGVVVPVTATTNWASQSTTAGTEYWEQSVTVPGLTATQQVDISLDADGLNQLLTDGVTALWAENTGGACVIKALGAAPTVALTLHLTLTEVSGT